MNKMRMTLTVILLGAISMAQGGTVAIRFSGNSTIERYAGEELQRYLSRATDDRFILRDASLNVWVPQSLVPGYGICYARALKAVEYRAADPNYKDLLPNEASIAQFEKEKALPAFILGTVESYPEYAAQFKKLLSNIREESDGYAIAASKDGSKLFITSHTDRGVLYGVYHYLQNQCGMGFFEDGERVPELVDASAIPPFKKNPAPVIEEPKYDYRGQWLWSRYYGSDKGHPSSWGYDEWVSHLRWMAQNRFSSAMIYATGYTRIWGDVFKRAFPEVAPFDKEVFDDTEDFWGSHWSARAGWGRNPEETTRLMQKVYAFGREKLGMQFEFNFYLGDFEDTLQRAYPEGNWIDYSNVPHHAYFGAAGRQSILTFTDPKCKEFSQRFWKEFINTFGTDHRYWISYREESAPDPDNPHDPDQGKSLADAVNAQREWMLEIDPDAKFYHWDWHGIELWFDKSVLPRLNRDDMSNIPLEELEASTQAYSKAIEDDITFVSVLPPGNTDKAITELTHHYDPHPWIIGSLIGYAMQDLGLGGLLLPVDQFLARWQRWADEDEQYGSRLSGVFHWNEIVQVSPLLDYTVANFAWSGNLPESFYDASNSDEVLDWYFEHRFGAVDAQAMRENSALACSNFSQGMAPMDVPINHNQAGLGEAARNQRTNFIEALEKLVAIKDQQGTSTAYRGEVLDFGRIALHTIARQDLAEALGCAQASTGSDEDRAQFKRLAERAMGSLTALADLLATDQRYCIQDTLYRFLNEPGVNRQMRMMVLEHASRMFNGYPRNDTAEFFSVVSVPLLKSYLENMYLTVNDPEKYPFASLKEVAFVDGGAVLEKKGAIVIEGPLPDSVGLDKRFLDLKSEFMELPALPFDVVKNPKHPADVLGDWLQSRD